jgi:cytokinin dehydrogenase
LNLMLKEMNNRSIENVEPNDSGVYPQGIKYPFGDLLRETDTETAIVAFDPIKKQWLTSDRVQSTPSIAIPNLNGRLRSDSPSLAAVADDFGHIIQRTPLAVLQPGSPQDIAKIVRYANHIGVTIAMRGQGHSSYGQAQVNAGIAIDSRHLNTIHHLSSTEVVVDAGVTLFELLNATLAQGLTVPVFTDYLGLSVGGLSQVGGIGGHTQHFGSFADTILALEAIDGLGQQIVCSSTQETELFNSLLGGLGQFSVVTKVTLPLIPAPTNVRAYHLSYTCLEQYLTDQERVLKDGRFSFLKGQVIPHPSGSGWTYLLEAASYYTPSEIPNDEALLNGLSFDGGIDVFEFGYFDWQNRLAPVVAELQENGVWQYPHPWLNLLLPGSQVKSYVSSVLQTLTASEVKDPILLYPLLRSKLTRPFIKTPKEEIIYLFSILQTAEPNLEAVNALLAKNRSWFEQARDLGGKSYPVNALPFSQEDWVRHFDDSWKTFVGLKTSLDPQKLLTPGQGIFTPETCSN